MDTSTNIKVQQGFNKIKKVWVRFEGPEHHDIKPQFRVVSLEPLKKMNPMDRIVELTDFHEAKNLVEISERFYKAMLAHKTPENDELFNLLQFRLGLWKELLIKG